MGEITYYAKILIKELSDRGIKAIPEYDDGHKSVDLFIKEANLIIEVDGKHHKSNAEQALADLKRARYSLENDCFTYHLPNEAVYNYPSECANLIKEMVENLKNKKATKQVVKKIYVPTKTKTIIIEKIREQTNKPRKSKKWFWVLLVLIILGFIFYPAIKDRVEMKNWADLPQTTPSINNTPQPIVCTQDAKQCPDGSYVSRVSPGCDFKICPALPDYIANGSMKNVIIKNNLASGISLNITYRIFSNWFGTDRTETQIFEVEANSEKSFEVYNNGGCVYSIGKTLDCSVSIIGQERI